MKTGEVEATIKRLIKREDGIAPALQLLEQMLGTEVISEKEAENLRRVIERRRIRLLAEAAVDGAEVDTSGMNLEDVLASMRDMVGETDNPDLMRMVDGVAATFGDDDAAGRLKQGGARARRSGNVVVAPDDGVDLGFAAAADGEKFQAVWLDDGEYIFSNKAIEGLGLRAGASRDQARDVGLAELEKLHNEVKAIAAAKPRPSPKTVEWRASESPEEVNAGAGAITVLRESAATMDERPIKQEKDEAPQISPADLIAETQIIDERRERAAVTDGTGRWHASDELINAVIAAESGGDPNAVSEVGAVGLLQILPSTARDPGFGVAGLEGSDEEVVAQLKNPEINRRLGSEYLSALLHRYHGDTDMDLAAYNAGPARADRAASAEWPLDKFAELYTEAAKETIPYIKRVRGNV